MTEINRLLDQFHRAYDGDSWAGPSLAATLQPLTAAQALRRPLPAAHCVWEIVLHLETWLHVVRRRVAEGRLLGPTDAENWPGLPAVADAAAWQQAQQQLHQAHEQLLQVVAKLRDDDLNREIPPNPAYPAGTPGTYYMLLHGVVQHTLYHTGQLALLSKATE